MKSDNDIPVLVIRYIEGKPRFFPVWFWKLWCRHIKRAEYAGAGHIRITGQGDLKIELNPPVRIIEITDHEIGTTCDLINSMKPIDWDKETEFILKSIRRTDDQT